MTVNPTQTLKVSSASPEVMADLKRNVMKVLSAMESTAKDAGYKRAVAVAIQNTRIVVGSK